MLTEIELKLQPS